MALVATPKAKRFVRRAASASARFLPPSMSPVPDTHRAAGGHPAVDAEAPVRPIRDRLRDASVDLDTGLRATRHDTPDGRHGHIERHPAERESFRRSTATREARLPDCSAPKDIGAEPAHIDLRKGVAADFGADGLQARLRHDVDGRQIDEHAGRGRVPAQQVRSATRNIDMSGNFSPSVIPKSLRSAAIDMFSRSSRLNLCRLVSSTGGRAVRRTSRSARSESFLCTSGSLLDTRCRRER